MKVFVTSSPPYFLLRVLRLAAGVVDRLDVFFAAAEVLLFAAVFFAGVFLAEDLAGDLAAADLDEAEAERLVLVERLGLGLAAFVAAVFAAVFLTDVERPLVEVLLLAGDLDAAAVFFAAGFFVTLRLRLAGAASSAASATFAVGFVDLRTNFKMARSRVNALDGRMATVRTNGN